MGFTWAERLTHSASCLLALLCFPAAVVAQDLEPRTYSNLPVGQNYLIGGYAHSAGEITPAPSVPIEEIDLTQDAFVGAYARTIDLWGDSGKVDVLSLDGNYFWGGKTKMDGVEADDLQKNSRVGLTLGWPLSSQYSVKFYANRGLVTRIGNDSDTLGVALQYRWGE